MVTQNSPDQLARVAQALQLQPFGTTIAVAGDAATAVPQRPVPQLERSLDDDLYSVDDVS